MRAAHLACYHNFKRFFTKVQNDGDVKRFFAKAQNDIGRKGAQNDCVNTKRFFTKVQNDRNGKRDAQNDE